MGGRDGQAPGLAAGRFLVDGGDRDQGAHAVLDPRLGKVEEALDHLLLDGLDVAVGGGGHLQHGDDLFTHGEGVTFRATHQPGQRLGDEAEEDQDGPEEQGEEAQGEDDIRREGVRTLLKDALGDDFTEDPDQGRGQDHRQPAPGLSEQVEHEGGDHGGVGHDGDVGAHQGG